MMILLQAGVSTGCKDPSRPKATDEGRQAAIGREANQAAKGQQEAIGKSEAEVIHNELSFAAVTQ